MSPEGGDTGMAYFPFFIELKNKKCCVVGGGMVAYRKIAALLEFDADITVISPVLCEDIRKLGDRLHIIPRACEEKDIEDAFLVIAATDDGKVNAGIAKACRDRKILVNTVDEIENCSFLFPAYVKRGDISIGVTTSGKSPAMAGVIKKAILEALPGYYEALVDALGKYRDYVKERVSSSVERSAIFKELASVGMKKKGKIIKADVELAIRGQEHKERAKEEEQ